MQFHCGPPTFCSLVLRPIISESVIAPDVFVLSYQDLDNLSDFIILQERYERSVERDFQVGQKVAALYSDDSLYEGTVVRISARDSPWEKYEVEW